MEVKCGEVASEYQSRLDAATEEQLERHLVRILSAQTIEEVFADPT